MAFNNASLGYVHAMAHQLGGFYDLPHGVCNALLLPHVEAFNAKTSADRLAEVARAMGETVDGMDSAAGARACLAAIRRLSVDTGIPASLSELGVKEKDIPMLAANALKDACGLTNPCKASQADIEGIFHSAMTASAPVDESQLGLETAAA
jgi:alcohol dehydrogenase